jgi:hypothetical protein
MNGSFMSGLYRSSNGSDFHLEIRAFPVVGFLVIELSLQADEEVAGRPKQNWARRARLALTAFF